MGQCTLWYIHMKLVSFATLNVVVCKSAKALAEPHQFTGWCTQPSGLVSMRAAVMGEPALLQLSTKSCKSLAACRACCSIRGASVSARQHISVSTLHQQPTAQVRWHRILFRSLVPGL